MGQLIFMQFMAGLSYGMLIFILAVGLSLVLGVADIVNFAHGSFYMLGAYLTYTIISGLDTSLFWVALLVVPVAVALVGLVCEIFLFRPIYRIHLLYQLLLTYALVFIFSDLCKLLWGTENFMVDLPAILEGSVTIWGQYFGIYNLVLIGLGPVFYFFLWFILNKTKMGNLVLAATVDREMLSALGVDTARLYTLVFVIGTGLAGLGGVLGAGLGSVNPGMAIEVILPCFIVVVIGGMGSLEGTLLGSFLLGQVLSFGLLILPRLALASSFILMTVVLILRPYGLFGKPER